MAATAERTLTANDLDIQALSDTEWRVSDKRVSPQDAFGLLGFIEKKHEAFEVMQLGRGFEWFTFASLNAAIKHFLTLDRRDYDRSEYVLSWMPQSS